MTTLQTVSPMDTAQAPRQANTYCSYVAHCYSEACAPAGYAIATILDQTWGYYNSNGYCWITHHDVVLFPTRAFAKSVARHLDKCGKIYDHCRWTEPVIDEQEFRARKDTW